MSGPYGPVPGGAPGNQPGGPGSYPPAAAGGYPPYQPPPGAAQYEGSTGHQPGPYGGAPYEQPASAGAGGPGWGQPGASPAQRPVRPPMDPARLAPLVVAALAVLNFIWGFLPAFSVPGGLPDAVPTSVYAVGPAYLPILLLIAGLLAVGALLPGGRRVDLPVAAVSVGAAIGVIVSFIVGGTLDLLAGAGGEGVSVGKGIGLILLLIFGILQAIVAVAAVLLSAGLIKAPAGRAAGSGGPTSHGYVGSSGGSSAAVTSTGPDARAGYGAGPGASAASGQPAGWQGQPGYGGPASPQPGPVRGGPATGGPAQPGGGAGYPHAGAGPSSGPSPSAPYQPYAAGDPARRGGYGPGGPAGARGAVPEQFPPAGSADPFPPIPGQAGPAGPSGPGVAEQYGGAPLTGEPGAAAGRPGPDDDNPEETQQVRF